MICPKCKKTLADGSKFCCYCGFAIPAPAAAGGPQGPAHMPSETQVLPPNGTQPASPDATVVLGPGGNLPEQTPAAPGQAQTPRQAPSPEQPPRPRPAPASGQAPGPRRNPGYPPNPNLRQNPNFRPNPAPGQVPPVPPAGRPPVKKKNNKLYLLLALGALLVILFLAAAVGAYFFFFRAPAGLADSELTGFLPRDAVITSNETEKKTQTVEYTYTKRYTYCDVKTSARLNFTYSGSWTPDPQEEVLNETEDWTRLAGTWTEADGSGPAIEITGFSSGTVAGTVSYTDTSSHSVNFRDAFGDGTATADPASGSSYYQFTGRGDFQGSYLRIERGRGVFFNNTQTAMEKDAAPLPPAPQTGSLEIEHGGTTETVDPTQPTPTPAANTLLATAVLNVRPEPNKDKEPIATVEVGTELTYTGVSNGWYQVQYQGQTGYVSADYIQDLAEPGTVLVLSANTELNVRSSPTTDSQVLTTVKSGDRMVSLGLSDGWYTIRYNDGRAYVSADYVTVVRTIN